MPVRALLFAVYYLTSSQFLTCTILATMKLLVILLVCVASAVAQKAPKPKPVSRYMRDIGILYLEAIEKLDVDCHCSETWEADMASLGDRIDIALNDKTQRRSAGDVPYWDLLRHVKYARTFYIVSDPPQRKAWMHAYITCHAYAHTVAIEGDYFNGDGGCGDAIDAATHQ